MPSPVAHALAGFTVAFVVDSLVRRPRLTLPILTGAAALAISPDLDLLWGSHRTHSHSIGAVAIVAVVCCLAFLKRRAGMIAAGILTAAYASHVPLDWLSKDTRAPSGLTALWPFSGKYYQSTWTIFGETSRRYWLPEEFIVNNMKEAMWEVAIMGPLLLIAWAMWSKRTLHLHGQGHSVTAAKT